MERRGRQWGAAARLAVAFGDRLAGEESSMATIAKMVREEKPPKFKVRLRNRCRLCGRPRGFIRKFALCRLCFRRLALEGDIAGVTKSSW